MPPLKLSPTERAVPMPFISEAPTITSITAAPAIVANKLKGNDKKFRVLMDEKYARTTVDSRVVHRIQALKRIERPGELPDIMPGDLGGYVLHEGCLSQDGSCWIADDAIVTGYVGGEAYVSGSAYIGSCAVVQGYSIVSGMAYVGGSEVNDGSLGSGRVRIYSSGIFDSAKVLGGRGVETVVSGFSTLSGACEISAGVRVYGLSSLIGRVKVAGDIEIDGGAVLEGDLSITCTDGVSKVHNEAVSYWNKEQHHIPLTLNLPDGCTSLVDYLEEVEGDKFPLRGVARHSGAFPGLGLPPNDNVELNTLINEAEQEYRYASNLRQFEGE